jgi:hypothetical protein
MSRKEALPIQRGDTTDGKERYRKAIEKAKAKGSGRQRPGDLENTPRFDDIQADAQRARINPNPEPPPSELSPETAKSLEAVAAASAAAARHREAQGVSEEGEGPEELSLEDIEALFGVGRLEALTIETIAYPERNTDRSATMRRAVENRCNPVDIGQYLMNGIITQMVPIIPAGDSHKGLTVVYRTVSDAIEVFVDKALSEEASKIRTLRGDDNKSVDVEMSKREYQRRSSEWALAAYIHSYQGQKWPNPLKETGDVNEDAMHQRLANVRQIPSQLFAVVSTNLGWFLERVDKEINVAALGNG